MSLSENYRTTQAVLVIIDICAIRVSESSY